MSLSNLTVTAAGNHSTISVTLSSAAHLSMAIVNSSGAVVKNKVVDQAENAGAFSVDYYYYDNADVHLPSGNYTIVVVATDPNQSLVIKTAQLVI